MFDLNGLWLLGALVIMYGVGVFTSQWAKDKIKGIPADLRAALSATEAAAVKELSAAKSKVVADTVGLIAKGKAAAAAPLPVAAVAAAAASGSQVGSAAPAGA